LTETDKHIQWKTKSVWDEKDGLRLKRRRKEKENDICVAGAATNSLSDNWREEFL
jgi:hypothetical protein